MIVETVRIGVFVVIRLTTEQLLVALQFLTLHCPRWSAIFISLQPGIFKQSVGVIIKLFQALEAGIK
jgi:hypothetical protein